MPRPPLLSLLLLAGSLSVACGDSDETPANRFATGGTSTTGGAAATGGTTTGGATATGGANTGGLGTGGTASGGLATGGLATGGFATGGFATGGFATGGFATGGFATGGFATGGFATGGMATGGLATGGVSTGGIEGTGGPSPSTGGASGSGGASSGGSGGTESGGAGGTGGSAGDELVVFLLIGQSNMEGVPTAQAQDQGEHPRVKVLAYDDCPNLGRTHDEWYPAVPPLHSCYAGLGPGDGFGKAMADAFPNATIGLVPCGISGVDIDFFRKGVVSARRGEFQIPPDNHWTGAYEWVITRAQKAQQTGTIRGILFHQGESDTGSPQWVGKVSGMVSDLRTDLGLGNVPFLAGELLYSGCCSSHNPLVNQLPSQISNAFVISASGLAAMDQYHFDLAGQRTLGARYATAMLGALGP